jgi:hypothetical protein
MTPTNELRFVERLVSADVHPNKVIRVLQQKWLRTDRDVELTRRPKEEWRDVPLVKDE